MTSLSQQDGFVFYQLPNSDEILFLSGNWIKIDLPAKQPLDGFIISNSDKSTVYFLEGVPTNVASHFQIDINTKANYLLELNKDQYLRKAQKFIDACRNGLQKVILSRIKKCSIEGKKNTFEMYLKLCKSYNHSFNYLLNIPATGIWMGATPEILIQGSNKTFTTVSLAGSKPVENVSWEQKELDEQQFVTEFITKKLNTASITHKSSPTPETIFAGTIAHLKTTFNIETKKKPLELANLLHPTPAVCGLPQNKAQEFILKNEGYNRDFYTGFLGPINNSGCNLFVNLRCMQVFEKEHWLYVGGGITADSIPENEWNETELKAQTLLNILD